MPSCSYHYPGSVYKVNKAEFDNYNDAILEAKQQFSKVYQIRPDGRKFLFYSAPADAKTIKKKKK